MRDEELGCKLWNFILARDIRWKDLLLFTNNQWLSDRCINAGVEFIRVITPILLVDIDTLSQETILETYNDPTLFLLGGMQTNLHWEAVIWYTRQSFRKRFL